MISSIKNITLPLLFGGLLLAGQAAQSGTMQLNFESPQDGSPYQGVANIRGWAISSVGIDRVELYIDGVYATDIPSGGFRQDVGNAFPDFPGSSQSGFSMAYNFSKLGSGSHQFKVVAVDNDGATAEATADISILSFDSAFIGNPDAMDLEGATVTVQGNTMTINDLTLDGRLYNAQLAWRPETQRYQFTSITLK